MTVGYYQGELRDLRGNALTSAVVDVFNAGTTTPATLFSNAAGTVSLTASPLSASAGLLLPGKDAAANVAFFADDSVEYDVRVTDPSGVFTLRVRAGTLHDGYVQVTERPRSPMQAIYGGAFTAANVMAALAGGAAVDLPPGTCVGSIAVPGGATLTGVPGKTVLQSPAGAATNAITNVGSEGFVLEGVVIDGNKGAATSGGSLLGNGVHLDNCDGVTIRKVHFRNTRHSGVAGENCDDVMIEDCDFEDCGDPAQAGTFRANAVTILGHRWTVTNNRIKGSAQFGVAAGATGAGQVSVARINGNRILDSGSMGVALGSFATDCEVCHNHIDGAPDNGIDAGSTVGCKIIANTVLNAYDGIDADLTLIAVPNAYLGLVIALNRVKICARHGIIVYTTTVSAGLTVVENQVETVQQHGVTVSNVARSRISGNTVKNFGLATPGFAAIQMEGACSHNNLMGNTAHETGTPSGFGYKEGTGTFNHQTLIGNDFSLCGAPYGTGSAGAGPNTGDIRLGNQ